LKSVEICLFLFPQLPLFETPGLNQQLDLWSISHENERWKPLLSANVNQFTKSIQIFWMFYSRVCFWVKLSILKAFSSKTPQTKFLHVALLQLNFTD